MEAPWDQFTRLNRRKGPLGLCDHCDAAFRVPSAAERCEHLRGCPEAPPEVKSLYSAPPGYALVPVGVPKRDASEDSEADLSEAPPGFMPARKRARPMTLLEQLKEQEWTEGRTSKGKQTWSCELDADSALAEAVGYTTLVIGKTAKNTNRYWIQRNGALWKGKWCTSFDMALAALLE